jgi:hypothetical protein
MPVDASIPLAINPQPQNQLAEAYGTALKIKQLQIDQQEQNYQVQQRNALRQMLSEPDAVDPATGRISSNTLAKVLKADPMMGEKLLGTNAQIDERVAQTAHIKGETYAAKQKALSEGAGASIVAYEEALKHNGPEAARLIAQQVYSDQLESLGKSGMFSTDEIDKLPQNFDPIRTRSAALTLEQSIREREADAALRVRATQGAERITIAQENAANKGEQILTDPKSNTQYIFNPTAPRGQKFTTLDGQPYTPQGAQKIAGGPPRSAAAMATQRFMEEHPNATADDLVKFNSDIAAGRAGGTYTGKRGAQLEQGVKAIDGLIDQAKETYSKLPRARFMPYNKLQQAYEKGTSDPDQAAAYVATEAVVNQWARNISPSGQLTVSAVKRGEAMLSTADSQEAYNRVLNQMKKESEVEKASLPQKGEGSHPPLNLLKEGTITTFKNGQKWKLVNGQAVHVP